MQYSRTHSKGILTGKEGLHPLLKPFLSPIQRRARHNHAVFVRDGEFPGGFFGGRCG